jgi:hypothetical protein
MISRGKAGGMSETNYLSGAARVLWAGRALEDALDLGDEVEVQAAVVELLRVSQARETAGGAVQGFEPGSADRGVPTSTDESLALVLTELDLGQTLLTAGHSVGEEGAPEPPAPLGDILDQLESDGQLISAVGEPAVWGFTADKYADQPPLDAFHSCLDEAVDAIVTRTIGVGTDVMTGLASIPVSSVQPWVGSTFSMIDSVPRSGPIVQAGMRAVRRAVVALERLVPDAIRNELRKLADRWRDEFEGGVVEVTARRLLGVGEVESAASQAFAQHLEDSKLRAGVGELAELSARHERTAKVVNRILRVLGSLLGPLVAAFAVAAAWLCGVAALAYIAALVAALWIGRDCLDTGQVWDRIRGVRTILAEVAA